MSVVLIITLNLSNIGINIFEITTKADTLPVVNLGSGSIGTGSNVSEASKLPRTSTQGTYRFTTDNYNNNHQALDTNDWASNWLWDLEGDRANDSTDALSGTAYAFPLCYLMKKDGLRVTKPAMTSNATNVSAYNIKDNDTLCDFNIYPEWTCTNNNVDEITDWSYRAVTTNPSNSSQKMTTTMTQGSPFMFVELDNTNVFTIEKLRVTFPSEIIFEGTYNGCKMVVFRTNDITSSVNGYPSATYQYYSLYLPEGSSINHLGTTDTTNNDKIGKLQITLPSSKTYFSLAWVDESQAINNDTAIAFAKEYRPYAFNFITDTKADYSYNESTGNVSTTYQYSFDKKAESTADGTIMGILPHQYKYMSGYSYMDNQAITLRGFMKFMKGSTYTTNMTYKGILPYMPSLSDEDTAGRNKLQSYVDNFVNTYMSGSGDWTLANDEGDETYYHGKKLNRSAQVVAAAKSIGDEKSATKVLGGLQANLEDWFTYSGSNDKHYFTYLGEGVGVLLGYQTSFNAVDQFNDHHFHYGYFIESAASVGLWDKEWLNKYKDVVKQLIYDIACPYRDNADCVADCGNAYPYLRSFSPYECHSWASGYEDERTGNNQESTSEAINAWAGIILFGELTGDTKIRDLGIYLYTSEIAAADNYWFDKDEDIYKIDNSKYTAPMASMVWGGKADYATWFGIKYTQGIQICPMQSWSFYLANDAETISGKEYIKKYYNADKTYSYSDGGSTTEWNDMWASYYALADPQTAMDSVWTKKAINDGESQAHTYHYIQSMIDYGTPNLSFTSDCSTASVFEKNGVYTYAVYNMDSEIKTVTFTDDNGNSVFVKAAPNTMTLMSSEDVGKASYTIEYYGKDLNASTYSLIDTSIKYANAGTSVTANVKDIVGYSYESANGNNVINGTVNSDNSLVLKVYYSRNTYSISYELNGGTKADSSLYPSTYVYGESKTLDKPTKGGYDFYGWYSDAELNTKVESIKDTTNGNITLYAKWIPAGTILINEDVYLTFDGETNGTFTIVGDASYDSVNVLYRISDTESEAKELADNKSESGFVAWGMDKTSNGWSRTENFNANSGKYITFYFIRYDSNGGYKTDYGYGRIGAGSGESETEVVATTSVESTVAPTEETTKENIIDPSTITDWTQVTNNSNVYYYICDNKGDKVTVKPEQHSDGIYIAYSLAATFKEVTLNGETKTVTDGAYYVVSNSDISNAGYYTLKVINYYGNETVSIVFKVTEEEKTEIVTTTQTPTTEKPTTTEAPTTTTIETTEADIEKPAKPIGLTYAGNENLPYYFAWQGVDEVDYYNFYVNGILVESGIIGTAYSANASMFPTAGEYTIGVTTVKNGVESDMTTITKIFEVSEETTTEETTVQETTEVSTTETETTTEAVNIVVNNDVQVVGYQISSTKEGSRVVGSVEPVIDGKTVEKWGFIYAIKQVGTNEFSVPDEEMYVGTANSYIKSLESTSVGTSNVVFGESKTATYFVRTTLFSSKNAKEFSAKYKVRAYALLSDGTYVYSKVSSYTVFDICDNLYQNKLMNTYDGHKYLYDSVLSVVDSTYSVVDYDWSNAVVKPENIK